MQPRSRTFLIDAAFVLAVAALIAVAGFALDARADPTHTQSYRVVYENPGPVSSDAVTICLDDECTTHTQTCGPSARCEAIIEVGYGCYELHTRVWVKGREQSEPSNSRRFCSISLLERYDWDGNGRLNVFDFGACIRAVSSGAAE